MVRSRQPAVIRLIFIASIHCRLQTDDSFSILLPQGAADPLAQLLRHLSAEQGWAILEEPAGLSPFARFRFRNFTLPALLRRSGTGPLLLHSGPAPLRCPALRLNGSAAGLPPFVPPRFHPLSPEEAAEWRLQHSAGAEYFLLRSHGGAHIREVLGGFSAFKRRLRSGLQLVVLGPVPPALQKDLAAYRYRSDLQLLPDGDAARFTAGAYAVLLPENAPAHYALEALGCGVPLLTPRLPEREALCGAAPLYVAGAEGWGPAMQRIYSDEALWQRCALAGTTAALRYPFAGAVEALKEHITFAAKTKKA